MSARIQIYSDGACRGNPGPGGWGALLCYNGAERALSGAVTATTNNRMELLAAIMGLEALTRPSAVALTTDSQYVKNGITDWLAKWKKNNWQTAAKRPVKNRDLWLRLDRACQPHRIEWQWVRGHSGHHENERADRLANQAIDDFLRGASK